MSNHIYQSREPFVLESGYTFPSFHLAYSTYGTLNKSKDNVAWIFHALTANSDAAEWWPGLVGEGKLFDPGKYFIICVNMPGSCYGSIGPLDNDPATGKPYYHDFPFFTTRDMIRTYQYLKNDLGIKKIRVGIGGSMGGQQLIEWAIEEPQLFEYIVPLATNALHSAWGMAFNSSQRLSIECDQTWNEKNNKAGIEGMKVARGIALISYRHYDTYRASQPEDTNENLENFKTESYQRYQGEKLARRFNAFSYYFLSKGMDAHNVGRGRESIETALEQIRARTLVIGIKTDILFPLTEQEFLASHIKGAKFASIESLYGHDGFLLEFEKIQNLFNAFLAAKESHSEIKIHSRL
ncbi:MAG: homoserine O-acetyltransferase [Ginsengibacter sp.]